MRLSEYEVAEDLMIDGLKVIQDTESEVKRYSRVS